MWVKLSLIIIPVPATRLGGKEEVLLPREQHAGPELVLSASKDDTNKWIKNEGIQSLHAVRFSKNYFSNKFSN